MKATKIAEGGVVPSQPTERICKHPVPTPTDILFYHCDLCNSLQPFQGSWFIRHGELAEKVAVSIKKDAPRLLRYSSFVTFLFMLWRMNRLCKKHGLKLMYSIALPLKWL